MIFDTHTHTHTHPKKKHTISSSRRTSRIWGHCILPANFSSHALRFCFLYQQPYRVHLYERNIRQLHRKFSTQISQEENPTASEQWQPSRSRRVRLRSSQILENRAGVRTLVLVCRISSSSSCRKPVDKKTNLRSRSPMFLILTPSNDPTHVYINQSGKQWSEEFTFCFTLVRLFAKSPQEHPDAFLVTAFNHG
jgi:hypothetical protein